MMNKKITDEQITKEFEALGGVDKFLKDFGYLQFARVIEELVIANNLKEPTAYLHVYRRIGGIEVYSTTATDAPDNPPRPDAGFEWLKCYPLNTR